MTTEQINEVSKVNELLQQCRAHLDKAMYFLDPAPTGDDYNRLRELYQDICSIQDKL